MDDQNHLLHLTRSGKWEPKTEGDPVVVGTAAIALMDRQFPTMSGEARTGSEIKLLDGCSVLVNETPKEVQQMIFEASRRKLASEMLGLEEEGCETT